MQIPCVRCSVWILMVIVALVASGIFTAQMIRKHRVFAELTEKNALSEKENREWAEDLRRRFEEEWARKNAANDQKMNPNATEHINRPFNDPELSFYLKQIKVHNARAARNADLRQKYQYAAQYPWFSVAVDPPELPDAEYQYDPVD